MAPVVKVSQVKVFSPGFTLHQARSAMNPETKSRFNLVYNNFTLKVLKQAVIKVAKDTLSDFKQCYLGNKHETVLFIVKNPNREFGNKIWQELDIPSLVRGRRNERRRTSS